MNGRIAAQHELASALNDVHESLARQALESIGVTISSWSEIDDNFDEINTAFEVHKDSFRIWDMHTILYDKRGAVERPKYPVPLLNQDSVSLFESSTPVSVGTRHLQAANPNLDTVAVAQRRAELYAAVHPLKYLNLRVHPAGEVFDDVTVFVGPDMPAIAVHRADLTYVEDQDHRLHGRYYQEHGLEVVDMVAKAFGEEAITTLSDEACIALAGAVRAADTSLSPATDNRLYF